MPIAVNYSVEGKCVRTKKKHNAKSVRPNKDADQQEKQPFTRRHLFAMLDFWVSHDSFRAIGCAPVLAIELLKLVCSTGSRKRRYNARN